MGHNSCPKCGAGISGGGKKCGSCGAVCGKVNTDDLEANLFVCDAGMPSVGNPPSKFIQRKGNSGRMLDLLGWMNDGYAFITARTSRADILLGRRGLE